MSKCLVTGTFDPITLGHEDLIRKAAAAFDEVAVAVLINPDKTPFFSEDRRVAMIKAACGSAVEAFSYSGLAVEAAKSVGASVLVRGFRNDQDVLYEIEMADFNRALGVETVFFPASAALKKVSSSAARAMLLQGVLPRGLMGERALALAAHYTEDENG